MIDFDTSIKIYPANMLSCLRGRAVIIFGIISLYWTVSISLVFVNKMLLHTKENQPDLSLFICWYQTLSGTLMISVFLKVFKKFTVQLSTLLHPSILSLSALFVTGLVLNMMMLRYIGVAFYQVARSTTLIFVVIFSYVVLHKLVSLGSGVCCAVVVAGFLIGADQEALGSGFSLFGITYGVAASLVIGLTSVVMKLSQAVKPDSLELTFYYNVIACAILTVLMISTRQFHVLGDSILAFEPSTWFWLTYSGLLSVGMGWASTLQIQYTSPMTHHISISAKSTLQTVMAVGFYREMKGALWWIGTLLTIVGTGMYALVKMQEERTITNSNQSVPSNRKKVDSRNIDIENINKY